MKFFIVAFLAMLGVVSAVVPNLSSYKISDATISGLSAGGYMAVQVHMAFSSYINGSAIFAGGPYYCAQGNVNTAQYKCMKTYQGMPNVAQLVSYTKQFAANRKIDPLENLKNDRVYLFSGTADTVVNPEVMQLLQEYYLNFIEPSNLVADFAVKTQHCLPTTDYGEACATLSSPYLGKCAFDGAGVALTTLYGDKIVRGQAISTNLMAFNQKTYIPPTKTFMPTTSGSSLADQGYIYVPTACQNGQSCHLHFAFHGCQQTESDIGSVWAEHAGYNEWAETNNIIVVYPYVKKSQFGPANPNGCWDWWGYTGSDYAVQSGVQMKFFKNIYTAITGSK